MSVYSKCPFCQNKIFSCAQGGGVWFCELQPTRCAYYNFFSLQGNRDENQTVDYQKAQTDAQRLYQAGEGQLGTDESSFNMVLATRSFPQLKATMDAYSQVEPRTGRELGEGFLYTLAEQDRSVFNVSSFFDERFNTSHLISLQVANRDLLSSIDREFSGNVESGLKAICKRPFLHFTIH